MKVLAFGIVRDIFGYSSIDVEPGRDLTIDKLKNILGEKYPALNRLGSFMIAVNNEYADGDQIIKPGDEVAIIPPVSGG